jgi:hypothetical protein
VLVCPSFLLSSAFAVFHREYGSDHAHVHTHTHTYNSVISVISVQIIYIDSDTSLTLTPSLLPRSCGDVRVTDVVPLFTHIFFFAAGNDWTNIFLFRLIVGYASF